MRYALIKHNDIANGPGVRISFWVQGCPFHCENCHNKDTWDIHGGKEFDSAAKQEFIKALTANHIFRDLSILGGEPLAEYNLEMTSYIISLAKFINPSVNIWLWTGFKLENLNEKQKDVLKQCNTFIDGQFKQELYNPGLKYRGSSNQRIFENIGGQFYETKIL